MNRQIVCWALALAVTGLGALSLQAQGDSGPLIEALVKKGVLSSQEGEELRTDMLADYSATAGGMLTYGSSAVKGLKLYGDARLRYQYENAQDQTNTGGGRNEDRSRYRYRLRVGADYIFAENWKAGVRFETADASDSTNTDLGGFFDKTGDEIYVGLVYLQYETTTPTLFGWEFADYYDARFGKHIHPYLISGAFWDGDINPEGLTQQVGWKGVFTENLGVTLRGGAYVIDEENNNGGGGKADENNEDDFLFMGQAEFAYDFGSKTVLKVAPMLLATTGGVSQNAEGAGAPSNENGQPYFHNFFALMLPAELKFKTGDFGHKIYGTYGINFEGAQRINDNAAALNAYDVAADQSGQNQLFNVGYELSKGKGKGAWKIGGEYRYIEAGSWDANLSDSDFGKNELNQQGVVATASYGFTDNISGGLTYMKSWDIDEGFDSGASDNHTVDLVQVDLMWKF